MKILSLQIISAIPIATAAAIFFFIFPRHNNVGVELRNRNILD